MRWLILCVVLLAGCGPRLNHSVSIVEFTSTNEVTSIAQVSTLQVAIGTMGGLQICDFDGKVAKFTKLSGMPSNEVLGLENIKGRLFAHFPENISCVYDSGNFIRSPITKKPLHEPTAFWKGMEWRVSGNALICDLEQISSPKGSAMLTGVATDGKRLWIGAYGAGVFERSGTDWISVASDLKEPTALAFIAGKLWVGTRRSGAFTIGKNGTLAHVTDCELPSSNVVSFFEFNRMLFGCTLDDGLISWNGSKWSKVVGPSTPSPRIGVSFKGVLYLRHANGVIDTFNGEHWASGFEKRLARPECSAIAASDSTMYFGQWGGWSCFDGKDWSHHFVCPELTGKQITVLAPGNDRLWVGTQRGGLIGFGPGKQVHSYGVAAGVSDDWITSLVIRDGMPVFGTFTGGAYRIGPSGLQKLATKEPEVRSICCGKDLLVATPNSVESIGSSLPFAAPGLSEIQTIFQQENCLWIACRTGIYRVIES